MASGAQHGRLDGLVAIVTGGAQGFGKAIVDLFVAQGAKVVVMDLNVAKDAPLEVAGHGSGSAMQLKANVCQMDDWKRAIEVGRKEFGDVPSICVNNAGWTYSNKSSLEVTDEDFDKVYQVNVKSVYLSSLALVPALQKRGQGGSFIQVASTAGIRPRPKLTWYNATKAAVIAASKSMALEFARDQIRFNCVNPVAGNTPLLSRFAGAAESGDPLTEAQLKQFKESVPLGRLSDPKDIANAVLFFADPASNFVTGVDLNVDGGRCV